MDNKKIIGIVVAVAVVAVGGYFVLGKKSSTSSTPIVNDTQASQSASVATVNGVSLSKVDFDNQLAASVTAYKGQGLDVSSTTVLNAIKVQVLNNLVNNELVSQGAKASGITATAEEVEKQYQALITQLGGADKLTAELTKANLTDAQLRENIAKQISAQKFILANINPAATKVTDADAKKFYDDNAKGQKNVPAFKDLKAQIIQQLTSQKQQAEAANLIQALRAKSKIEVNLK